MLKSTLFLTILTTLILTIFVNFSEAASRPSSGVSSVGKTGKGCESMWLQAYDDTKGVVRLNGDHVMLSNLCDQPLRSKLKAMMATNNNSDYTEARRAMFGEIDNHGHKVCCVYTGKCIETYDIPSDREMNCEHTWPQSKGAKGVAKADLHHLFPVETHTNSMRGNLPFCEVTRVTWQEKGARLGFDKNGTRCFQPPSEHRGNVARAIFYFAVRYEKTIASDEEAVLRRWNQEDPATEDELLRNDLIEKFQHNRNLFEDYSWLVEMISDF
ncbi:MAG: endonuclease [Oligoflexia bacterium]|nr:endonuclease [Oligoflexia bacterium]MBF0366516.1 endonuclease [Oligoflexia bacterium]